MTGICWVSILPSLMNMGWGEGACDQPSSLVYRAEPHPHIRTNSGKKNTLKYCCVNSSMFIQDLSRLNPNLGKKDLMSYILLFSHFMFMAILNTPPYGEFRFNDAYQCSATIGNNYNSISTKPWTKYEVNICKLIRKPRATPPRLIMTRFDAHAIKQTLTLTRHQQNSTF